MAFSFVLKFYPSETRIKLASVRVASLEDFNFEALCQCARKKLPNEQISSFKWKDDDGELISLETDDDLLEALHYMKCTNHGEACLRIYPTVVASFHEPTVNECVAPSQSGQSNMQSLATAQDFPDRKPKLETLGEAIVVDSQPENTVSSEYVLAVVCKEEDCIDTANEAVDTTPSADANCSSDVETGDCKDLASVESTTLAAHIKREPKVEPADESLQEAVVNAEEAQMEQEVLDTAYLRVAVDSSQSGQQENCAVANMDQQIHSADENASDQSMLETEVEQVAYGLSNNGNSSLVCDSAQPQLPEAHRSPSQVFAVKTEPVNDAPSANRPVQVAAGGNLLAGSPPTSIPNSTETNHQETLDNVQQQLPLRSRFGRVRKLKAKPNVAPKLTAAAGPSLAHNASADVAVEFDCGDMVWAHLGRYPWWPSIVAPDPSTRSFTQIKGRSRAYYVFFLGDATRSWVSRSSLIPFEGKRKFFDDDYMTEQVQSVSSPVMRRKIEHRFQLGPRFESQWHNAISLAEEAASLQKLERLDSYCILPTLKSTLDFENQVEPKRNVVTTSAEAAAENEKRYGDAPTKRKRTSDANLLQPKPKARKTEAKRQTPRLSMPLATSSGEAEKSHSTAKSVSGKFSEAGNSHHKPAKQSMVDVKPEVEENRSCSPKSNSASEAGHSEQRPQLTPLFFRNPRMMIMNNISKSPVCFACFKSITDSSPLTICSGACNRKFHASCVNAQSKCAQCSKDQNECFRCRKPDVDANLVKCNVVQCGKWYHYKCVEDMCFKKLEKNDGGKVTLCCPHHFCVTCGVERNARTTKGNWVRCVECPVAYHANDYCIPAGTQILNNQFIRCCNHIDRSRKTNHVNARWCFLCADGGELVCCDKCPASFHVGCLDLEDPSIIAKLDPFYCDDCELGKRPLYGDIVWVKLESYRWWPAEVCHPKDVPDNIEVLPHEHADFVVRFFGSHNYYWTSIARSFLFYDGDQASKESCGKQLAKQVTSALNEAEAAHQRRKADKEVKDCYDENKFGSKPDRYKHVRSNKPVGDVQIYSVDPEEHPQCNCTAQCGDDCLNRMLYIECHPKVCRAGESCQNQRFQKCLYAKAAPFRTNHCGWGLKSEADIKKGEFVCEYLGDLISVAEMKRRLKAKAEANDGRSYFFALDNQRIIDAGPAGNMARLMNHSCDPNCIDEAWQVLGDKRIGLFALRDIKAGEELTYRYILEDLGEVKQKCKCGSANCSGVIGAEKDTVPTAATAVAPSSKTPKRTPTVFRKVGFSGASVSTDGASTSSGVGAAPLRGSMQAPANVNGGPSTSATPRNGAGGMNHGHPQNDRKKR